MAMAYNVPISGIFVDALLSGHVAPCDSDMCGNSADFRTDFDVVASEWGPCTSCFTRLHERTSLGALQGFASQSYDEIAGSANPRCTDVLDQMGEFGIRGYMPFAVATQAYSYGVRIYGPYSHDLRSYGPI